MISQAGKPVGFVLVAAALLLAACDAPSSPSADAVAGDIPTPSFSENCIGTLEDCNAAQEAINDLQNHSNPYCQMLGDEAADRFNDPHGSYNSIRISDNFLYQFNVYPDSDQHVDAPYETGHSYVDADNGVTSVQSQVAGNEAEALGQDGLEASVTCR